MARGAAAAAGRDESMASAVLSKLNQMQARFDTELRAMNSRMSEIEAFKPVVVAPTRMPDHNNILPTLRHFRARGLRRLHDLNNSGRQNRRLRRQPSELLTISRRHVSRRSVAVSAAETVSIALKNVQCRSRRSRPLWLTHLHRAPSAALPLMNLTLRSLAVLVMLPARVTCTFLFQSTDFRFLH